jgi:hypothetical protein
VPGGAEIGKLADEAIAQFKPENPSASVTALLAIRSRLGSLAREPLVDDKRRQLDRLLAACLGLSVDTTVAQVEAVPGEELSLRHTAQVRSSIPVRWMEVRYPENGGKMSVGISLQANQPVSRTSTPTLPVKTPLTQPYWLREESTAGMFRVSDRSLIGRPENLPAFPVENVFEVGGQVLVVQDEPVEANADPAKPEMRRRLEVIPPVSIKFVSEVELFAPGAKHPVNVEINGLRPGVSGTLELETPAGWLVSPSKQSFKLAKAGDRSRITFTVTAPSGPRAP